MYHALSDITRYTVVKSWEEKKGESIRIVLRNFYGNNHEFLVLENYVYK